ncbi:MAG: hypothetical protein WAN71_21080 [Mycobacterium sp.]|uniref:hypothetical protein n=1 Tax=Mycobacterium sp. TaxID=1785 RepID=UPI003BAED3FE
MMNARGIARVGMLAVGLGVGAAIASTPGTASADTSTDWLSSLDSLLGGALPGADTAASALDIQISINGMDLLPTAGNAATANSGLGDFAIAIGNGATANATGGAGNYALADGTDALANAGGGSSSSTFDTAIDIGNNTPTTEGFPDGAFAGAASLIDNPNGGTGSFDTAIDIGNNGPDPTAPIIDGNSGAFAGAGGLVGLSGNGNNDTAIDFGNNNGFGLGPAAVDGNSDSASQSGNFTGDNLGSFAGIGNNDIASEVGNGSNAVAGGSFADTSLTGNNDIAYVFDPTGTMGSNAFSGADTASGNSDLAAVLGVDNMTATAQNANFLYDIITLFGTVPGSAAVDTSSNFLTDLLSLF